MNILYLVLVLICMVDIFISYKKFNKVISIILKVLLTAGMITVSYFGGLKLHMCSCIILLSSIIDMYTLKDEREDLFFPIKASLTLYVCLKMANISFMNDNLIYVIINMFILMLYISSNSRWVKNIDLTILLGINVLSHINIEYKLIPHLFNLIILFVDFYLIYLKEYKHKVLLDVLFGLLFIHNMIYMIYILSTRYTIAVVVLYAIMICITKKDKAVFIISLLGYLLSSMYFLLSSLDNNNLVYFLSVLMTFMCFIVLDQKILKKYHG